MKLDLFPGITCSTLKKIFTEFIFTSRSPFSQGALLCPPSLPLALHLPRASSRLPFPPPSCYNTRLCERNNVYSPSRMGGLEMKRAASPLPRPRAALGGGRRRNSCRNADGDGRREGSPSEGINIQPRQGDKYSCWRREGGQKEREGPGDQYSPGSIIFLCSLRVCWKFPAGPAGFTGP